MKNEKILFPALVFIGVLLFFFALGRMSLWDNDEPTYAEIAREMMVTGSWLTPAFNHQVWICHPPLYMWLTGLLFKAFGANEITARFFPAAFAVAGLMVLFRLASGWWGRKTGFLSALILASSLQYLVQGRMATMDTMLNTFLLLSFALAWKAMESGGKWWWPLFFASCAMATLAKGVFGLAYPIFIFGAYFLFTRADQRWKKIPWGSGLLIYLGIAAPWFAYETASQGRDFLHQIFYFYTFKRVVSPILRQSGPIYYYMPVLLFGFFPWSGFLPFIFSRGLKAADDPRIRFLIVWTGATFLFFSLVGTKLPNYILFLYPPLSMLLARFWPLLSRRQIAAGISLNLILLLFLAGGLLAFGKLKLLPGEIPAYLSHLFPLLGILFAGGCAALVLERARAGRGWVFTAMAAAVCVFWLAMQVVFSGVVESYKPMKPLALSLAALRARSPARVLDYHVSGTASLVFYTQTRILNLDDPDSFLSQWRGQKSYCFMDDKTFSQFKNKMRPFWTLDHRRTLWLLANFDPRLPAGGGSAEANRGGAPSSGGGENQLDPPKGFGVFHPEPAPVSAKNGLN